MKDFGVSRKKNEKQKSLPQWHRMVLSIASYNHILYNVFSKAIYYNEVSGSKIGTVTQRNDASVRPKAKMRRKRLN